MSQNSQDAIDVLSKVIVDTIEKKLNDAKFDKSQTGVVTAVSGNTYTISVFGSQYNITSDQIYTVGQSVVVTALQGDMKRLVCSPDNIGTMKTVDSKVNVVGSQLSIIDTDFADTIVKYTDVSEFLTLKDQGDGQLSLWFYSGVPSTDTDPTVNWVTEDAKRVHIGDLYYDMKADDAYRWTDTFIWETLSDKNLLKVLRAASLEIDTANGSRRVFFTTPSTPYSRGDIWASSSGDNKVLVCQTARPITESFSRTDWAVALKYTDDTKANEALDAAGKPYIKLVASNGLDEKKIANMELYEHAHFDSYGVGENLITSASDPVFGGVYKLVAVKKPDGSYTPKMKCSDSASKAIIPGKKMPWRLYDENGQAQCDLIAMDGEVIEAGKPVTMVNLDSDAIERTITFTPTAVRPLLVPHILGGKLAIELPSIAEKKAYIAKQLTEETWESELRLECPHKHYVNMTPAVAECRSRMYAELHGGKV